MRRATAVWTAAVTLLVGATACGGGGQSQAQRTASAPGITADTILLGTTDPLSGPASAYGTIARSSEAYFKWQNDNGGVNGRKIDYKILDDAYNPAQTVQLTRELVSQDKVFATFGGLGTQAQTSVEPYMNQQKVPQLFVATGATKFGRDYKKYPYTIGWQPAYQGESIIYAKQLLKTNPSAKIGVLYQNDDYGQDYLDGLTKGLGSKQSLIIDKESYDVTADVKSQVAKLKASGADTFFIFSTPKFAVQAMATAFVLGWHPAIYLNSVSNSQVVMQGVTKATGSPASTDGVISVIYIKDPTDAQWDNDNGMKQYRQIMAKYYPSGDVNDGFNVFGMASAYTMIDVLKQAGTNPTRDQVKDLVSRLNETNNPFLLPGVKVKTSSDDHFPITQEKLIKYQSGHWVSFGDLFDARGQLK
jgi:branched-chain amino acid transport system substrate-binding protein